VLGKRVDQPSRDREGAALKEEDRFLTGAALKETGAALKKASQTRPEERNVPTRMGAIGAPLRDPRPDPEIEITRNY